MNHQFWCPRHDEYFVEDERLCSVMAGRCPSCVATDAEYNQQNVGSRFGPAAFSPAFRCVCRNDNKRVATTGMWA